MKLGVEERTDLARLGPALERALELAVARLYADIRSFAPALAHFDDEGRIEHARRAQLSHWRALMAGDPDYDYEARAKRIGESHARIGLDHRIYLSGYAIVLDELLRVLCGADGGAQADAAVLARARGALIKLAMLDMSLVVAAYLDASEQQSLAKSRFLASLAHDLRTPLNAVIGHAELALEELQPDPQRTGDIGHILAASQGLLRLVNGLLDLAKTEAGTMSLAPATFDVAEFVRNAIEDVQEEAARNGDSVAFAGPGEGAVITTDPDKLGQILNILLMRAISSTRHGAIVVRAFRQQRRAREMIVFQVADTGMGLSAQQLAQFRGEQAELMPGQAGESGLGLALARSVARRLGADLTVESESGKGATFSLALPAASEAEQT